MRLSSAGASLNEPLQRQKFSLNFLTTFSVVTLSPPPIDLFSRHLQRAHLYHLWAPVPNPFRCGPPFTPTFKAFHYQWGSFTPWWGSFTPVSRRSGEGSSGVVCAGSASQIISVWLELGVQVMAYIVVREIAHCLLVTSLSTAEEKCRVG